LTTGAVAAALARVYLAAIGQKLRKSLNVFVVNVLYTTPAKAALSLFPAPCKTWLSPVAASATFFLWTSL